MPCRHADCEGTAWHIITIGLSVHHYRLQACASLQDAAAHLPDHCLPVSAVYTLVWMASDTLLYSCLTIANLSLLSLQWSGWLLIRFSLKGHPMCRSLRFGLRHPVHCLSHHSSDGVWARCYVQEPEHECHSQNCVTACDRDVRVSARGIQPKLDVMIDLTVTHCITYDVVIIKYHIRGTTR
jgi:hypothetical protein